MNVRFSCAQGRSKKMKTIYLGGLVLQFGSKIHITARTSNCDLEVQTNCLSLMAIFRPKFCSKIILHESMDFPDYRIATFSTKMISSSLHIKPKIPYVENLYFPKHSFHFSNHFKVCTCCHTTFI